MVCRISGILVSLFLLSACSSDDARLRDLYDVGTGPEEFAVLPSKPLIIPNNLTKLPIPDASIQNRIAAQCRAMCACRSHWAHR